MPIFHDLPSEIRLHIYQYVFQDITVKPYRRSYFLGRAFTDNPITRKVLHFLYRGNDGPYSQLVALRIAFTDPTLLEAFFTNAVFALRDKRQWSIFKEYLHICATNDSQSLLRIRYIKMSKRLWRQFGDALVDENVLPNLKVVNLDLFELNNTYEVQLRMILTITDCLENADNGCSDCEPPFPAGQGEHPLGRMFCKKHLSSNPSRFALSSACGRRIVQHPTRDITLYDQIVPCDFILWNFFNDFQAVESNHRTDINFSARCRSARMLKQKLLNDKLECRMSWPILFPCAGTEKSIRKALFHMTPVPRELLYDSVVCSPLV